MEKLERFFLFGLLGLIAPLTGFLAAWFGSSYFLKDWQVFVAGVCGGLLGLGVNGLILKKWVAKAYQMNFKVCLVIFLFFSICVFGFFMGVPVFNLLLAIPAGIYIACRQSSQPSSQAEDQKVFRNTKTLTTLIFGMVCVASAIIALVDPYTAANLEGMFSLNFELTQGMIIGLIVVGGSVVLLLNWWLMEKTIQITLHWKKRTIPS